MSAFDAPVRGYMNAELVSVKPTATVAQISALLQKHDISAVPVMDGPRLRGIVSVSDILRSESEAAELLHAGHMMQATVITVAADASLREAAQLMTDHRIHRVVVCEGETPVGVLSTRDAMAALVEERVTATVRSVTTTPVQTVDHGDTIDFALATLEQANVRGLVVLDEDWPIGVFTQTEALRARLLPGSLRAGPVENVMSYEMVCMDVENPLYRVARQARALRVRRIVVVEHKRLYGIASGVDLVRWIAEHSEAWPGADPA